MAEDISKKVLSITKNATKNNSNILISPTNNNKNQNSKEKKLETFSNSRTSECSQKTKKEEKEEKEKKLCPKEANINDTNILLNKEQLYETFLLFQKFLSATQSLSIDNNNKNINTSIKNDFISTLNNIKEIISNKENMNTTNDTNNSNILSNMQKEVNKFMLDKEKQEDSISTNNNKNITSNFQKYNKNSVDKNQIFSNIKFSLIKSNNDESKNNLINNLIITDRGKDNKKDKDEPKKIIIKKSSAVYSSDKYKNISGETIKEFKDINCSKINPKNNNESFVHNKKNSSNDYSFDFTNNNFDEYSCSIGDSLQIMTTDLFKTKINKNNNIDSIKLVQNYNKTNKINDGNKINYNINNNNHNIESARQIRVNNYIEPCEESNKNTKRIKVIKSSNKNMELNNKELIIEEKIKELNNETIKFREERDKVIKLKKEYENLHEQLLKDIESFKEKKEIFEKYRNEELNKIKEEKNNIAAQSKIFTNMKMENQSLNISNKNDKEMINNLRNYIMQLKAIIKKKDEEIKMLSKNNNNNNNNKNNYCINSYKSLRLNKDENCTKNKKIENKNKSYKNPLLIKNNGDKSEKGYMINHSRSKARYKLDNDQMNKSNSVIYFSDNINIDIDKKGRNYVNSEENKKEFKLNSFSGNIFNSQTNINTSTNGKSQKIKLNLMPKKINDVKNKNNKNKKPKKLNSTNFDIKKKKYKNINEKINSKNLNDSMYENNRNIQDFSKTSTNFLRQKPKNITKEDSRNYKDKILKILNKKKEV